MHFVQMVLNFDKMSRKINHDLQDADGGLNKMHKPFLLIFQSRLPTGPGSTLYPYAAAIRNCCVFVAGCIPFVAGLPTYRSGTSTALKVAKSGSMVAPYHLYWNLHAEHSRLLT